MIQEAIAMVGSLVATARAWHRRHRRRGGAPPPGQPAVGVSHGRSWARSPRGHAASAAASSPRAAAYGGAHRRAGAGTSGGLDADGL